MSQRRLIINGDDFGRSLGINHGIIEAFERGVLTSASLMVRWPAASRAAIFSLAHPRLAVGLHLDLGEWAYRSEEWAPLYQVVSTSDRAAVEHEVFSQLERFRELTGRNPTHLDSHQHVHREEPVRSVLVAVAASLGVPLRDCGSVRYCGDFYGQTAKGGAHHDAIEVDALVELIASLPQGTTELSCHPAVAVEIQSMYGRERVRELRTLCDPRVATAIAQQGIDLCSFKDVGAAEVGMV
jgi:predicted glycoside hydrolase/deacetylase ChbG (UPF0249 family)